MDKKKSWKIKITEFFVVIITLFAVLSVVVGILYYDSFDSVLSERIAPYGITGIFLTAFFLDFIPQYFTPLIGIFTGMLLGLGPWTSFLAVSVGSSLGAFLGFTLGRKFGPVAVRDWFGKEREIKIRKGMNKWGKWCVFLSTFTPLPYVPLLFGALELRRDHFIILGMIPRVLGYAVTTWFLYFVL